VRVDGAYGPATARVVKHYRKRLNIGDKGVVTPRVWRALNLGRVLPARARR
jgi:peptidoglycan hydrolase-like protein with peptidoglycan-binding domain